MSSVISSPSRTMPIGPPRTASGATWPAIRPCVAPEKRPSVSSATSSPSPSPTSAAVTASISRMPGPPAGPSLRMSTTAPALIPCARAAATACSSRPRAPSGLHPPPGPGLLASPVTRDLDHAPLGGEVALEDHEPAGVLQRVLQWADDLLALDLLRLVGALADRLARDRLGVLVEDPGLLESLQDNRDTAGGIQ